MSNEVQVKKLTDIMAQFVGFTAKKLPDDVIAKLQELRDKENSPMTNVIYDTMFRNQELALKLNRPSCQDTGVLQFWVKCGTKFPLIDNLEALLKDAVMQATVATPLRHNSVETAALNSKKALMRPVGSHNDNANAAKMEKLLEDGINAIGLGPQGIGGNYSVMGVNIENTARHPSAIGVAVNVGCWSHRRGHIVFDKDLNFTVDTHTGFEYKEEN